MNCVTCRFIKGRLGNPDKVICLTCDGILYAPNPYSVTNEGKCEQKCNFRDFYDDLCKVGSS